MSWFKRWIGIYVNFAAALLAPVILFYLIAVLPIYILPDSTDDGDNSSDSNTFFENVAPDELFLFVGLFSYSATIVIYFLYRNTLTAADQRLKEYEEEVDKLVQESDKRLQETTEKVIRLQKDKDSEEESKESNKAEYN